MGCSHEWYNPHVLMTLFVVFLQNHAMPQIITDVWCLCLELFDCMQYSSDTVPVAMRCCGVMLGSECHYELQNVSAMFRVH